VLAPWIGLQVNATGLLLTMAPDEGVISETAGNGLYM
jgi:hypothetical protein